MSTKSDVLDRPGAEGVSGPGCRCCPVNGSAKMSLAEVELITTRGELHGHPPPS